MKRICVYSGSNPGNRPEYREAAGLLGEAMVERGYELVYGGSSVGLMGKVAEHVLAKNGKAIGVMPKGLFRKEIAHSSLSEFHEVDSMHERKALMANLSDAFIALPGGLGTYEELFEVACWSQIGIHRKPIGLLDVMGFYQPLVAMLEHTVREGFMKEVNLGLIVVDADPYALLDKLESYTHVDQGVKWTELPKSDK